MGIQVIVKRLSSLDTKGFRGEKGTFYISLPTELSDQLPMTPYGKNSEPRFSVRVESRLDIAPERLVVSDAHPTNITHVGAGAIATSHTDLRLNILVVTVRGILHEAERAGLVPPHEGDLAVVELPAADRPCRITFVTTDGLKAALVPYLTEKDETWGSMPHEAWSALLPWPGPE